MAPVRYAALAIVLVGCSGKPVEPEKNVTGSVAAVAGLPRYREAGWFKVENCCTFQLGSAIHVERPQGIDSAIYDVTGQGYTLHIVFGPYDGAQPQPGYRFLGERLIDGVKLSSFKWNERGKKAPEGRVLWLAQVGGGRVENVHHTPWGLRIMISRRR